MHKNGCPLPAAPAALGPWGSPVGAPDRDKDGIADDIDMCPDTPGVKTTEATTNGCPLNPWGAPAGASDRDKDGVPDTLDACPDVAGVKTADAKTHGCPAGKTGTIVVGAPVALQPAVAKVITPVAVAPVAPAGVWYKPWTWF